MYERAPLVGSLVWARVEGWPFWPAVVVNRKKAEARVAEDLVAKFPRASDKNATVMFFNWNGTFDVVGVDDMEEFTRSIKRARCRGPHQEGVRKAAQEGLKWIRDRGTDIQKATLAKDRFAQMCEDVGLRIPSKKKRRTKDNSHEIEEERQQDQEEENYLEEASSSSKSRRRTPSSPSYVPTPAPSDEEEEDGNSSLEPLEDMDDLAPPLASEYGNDGRESLGAVANVIRKRARFSDPNPISNPAMKQPLGKTASLRGEEPKDKNNKKRPLNFTHSSDEDDEEEGDEYDSDDWTPQKYRDEEEGHAVARKRSSNKRADTPSRKKQKQDIKPVIRKKVSWNQERFGYREPRQHLEVVKKEPPVNKAAAKRALAATTITANVTKREPPPTPSPVNLNSWRAQRVSASVAPMNMHIRKNDMNHISPPRHQSQLPLAIPVSVPIKKEEAGKYTADIRADLNRMDEMAARVRKFAQEMSRMSQEFTELKEGFHEKVAVLESRMKKQQQQQRDQKRGRHSWD